MASSTADEVCDLVTGDQEYLFPGSDDDFDVGELEYEYDPLDREQLGKQKNIYPIHNNMYKILTIHTL